MVESYIPVNCSPEKFYDLFARSYKKSDNHLFINDINLELCPSKKPRINTLYVGSTIRGVKEEAYVGVSVSPYFERRIFSGGKTQDIGSVVISTRNNQSEKLAVIALTDITKVKLKRVSKTGRK